MRFKLVIAALFLALSLSALADIAVISYNVGQLKKNGVDLVPCTNKRIAPQINHMLLLPEAPINQEKYFVLAIQELWTKKAFTALKKAVEFKGLNMFPTEHREVKSNGLVTITNLKILEAQFNPYTHDTYAKKGMLYLLTQNDEGIKIGILNVHTGFSEGKRPSQSHLNHFSEISSLTALKKNDSDHFILAGDFNAGPDMILEKQKYDMIDLIWSTGLLPEMNKVDMKRVDSPGITWDNTHNPLVYKPTFLLKLYNITDHGKSDWGQNDSTMDHIFISNSLKIKDSQVVFKDPVPLKCTNRTTPDGKSTLSDHYGVLATLQFD